MPSKADIIESLLFASDKPVPLNLADLQMNRDRALEEAQAALATMKPWSP